MKLSDYTVLDGEKPLDRMVSDGGLASIFRRFAVIGDSLSSGEFEAKNAEGKKTYHDMFEYSWGQVLARECGSECVNLSRGGMTAKEFLDSFGEKVNYLDACAKSEAIIIALGANDISRVLDGSYPFGFDAEKSDEENFAAEKADFAGWYATLLRNVQKVCPFGHVFLMTMPSENKVSPREEMKDLHAEMLYRMADFFPRTHVIDLRKYAPVYDDEFKRIFYMSGHLNPAGYVLTGRMVASYLDYLIRLEPDKYCQLGFAHSDIVNPDYFK